MAYERHHGPTPAGGTHSVGVYVLLETLEEVSEAAADGIVVTELDADGRVLSETIASLLGNGP